MSRIQYINDVNGSFQEAHGSDGRLNVSSRQDSRGYYNSRDVGQCYALTFDHPAMVNGEYCVYWKNTSPTKEMVISSIGINSTNLAHFSLKFVTGTAANGTEVIPQNLNKTSANDADSVSLDDGGGTAISGLTEAGDIDQILCGVHQHQEFRLAERVRLGQNDAIAVKLETGTSAPSAHGVIFAYFE